MVTAVETAQGVVRLSAIEYLRLYRRLEEAALLESTSELNRATQEDRPARVPARELGAVVATLEGWALQIGPAAFGRNLGELLERLGSSAGAGLAAGEVSQPGAPAAGTLPAWHEHA